MKSIRKSKIIQFPLIKKPLVWMYDSYWYMIQHGIKDDKKYLSFLYWTKFGRKLNWDNPQTFNEKLQWLKLYCHKPLYVTMADKYDVKKYGAERIGEEYVVPNLGVWNNVDEIDFNALPNQFVLKCTHDSGGNYICKDKTQMDVNQVKKWLSFRLSLDYYLPGRDKQYRDIPKKIIADKYLDDGTGSELRDYKWWCFDGKPVYMYYTNKGEHIYENFYDMEYNPVDINHGSPRLLPELPKPANFELMKDVAAKLSKNIPFVRVDFFDVGGHVFFGEFTFFDWGGLKPFKTYEMDLELGKLINLPH